MIKGSDLENRMSKGTPDGPAKGQDTEDRLRLLLERIAQARATRDGEERHCADCFRRGRDAALKIIDGV